MAVVWSPTKKAKQAKLRLPLTYKRLIVWDIYGPLYVIGKRKQQGSSNFAPRKTFPLEGYLFCDDQSAFSIPLGINEKKALNSNFTKVKSHFTHFTNLLLSFYIRKKLKKNL